jgi:hypothetical protein
VGFIYRLKRKARPLARFGCASIGTVYVIVGVLALLALAGQLPGMADEDRMLRVVDDLPGGSLLIWGIAIGLFGYIGWRLIEAIADPYDFGSHLKGYAIRTGIVLSAVAYGVIAVSAARFALGNGNDGNEADAGEERQQLLVAQVLEWPGGPWLVGIAGTIVGVMALLQVVLIVRRSYTLEIDLDSRAPATRYGIHILAWYGYAARGVILAVFGYFLIAAAWRREPGRVGDTDTAFDTIGGGTIGDLAFLLVALGTVAYGLFMYASALFYEFQTAEGRT